MKDQYTADVGDYGKYGLLRHLFPSSTWRLGMVWYLTPPEIRKARGRDRALTQYLDRPAYRNCDPDLFDKLRVIARPKEGQKRTLAQIEKAGILGKDTLFFSEILDFRDIDIPAFIPAGRDRRLRRREEWLAKALACTTECDAVFLDPDNGLEIDSTARHEVAGPKFVFMDELQKFVDHCRAVVVYHHLNRHGAHGTHARQIVDRKASILKRISFGEDGDVMCLRYSPYNPRAFFILARKQDIAEITEDAKSFLTTPWRAYFELR
jgi:hypothetical protein